MTIVLIDNGSLEPAAHLALRTIAGELSQRWDRPVHPVSWKHSDRIPAELLAGTPAWSLRSFVSDALSRGNREFVFVPFFISAQGAIGSALRHDLEQLRREQGPFEFVFTPGLAALQAIPRIVADRVRTTLADHHLTRPPVVLVDHGGPSRASADLRDRLADELRTVLGDEIGPLTAASMEGDHPPLLPACLRAADLAGREVVVALLFLAPGRHAGPGGDIASLCAGAPARCFLTEPIGTHPLTIDTLAAALPRRPPTTHPTPSA